MHQLLLALLSQKKLSVMYNNNNITVKPLLTDPPRSGLPLNIDNTYADVDMKRVRKLNVLRETLLATGSNGVSLRISVY